MTTTMKNTVVIAIVLTSLWLAKVTGSSLREIRHTTGITDLAPGEELTPGEFVGTVAAGAHTLVLGGYNNLKTLSNESTTVRIDDVRLEGDPVAPCLSNAECDDGNVCTDDLCDAGTCVSTPNVASCDDGLGCTVGDVCSGGVCGGADVCPAESSCQPTSGLCEASAAWTLVDALSLQNFTDHVENLSSSTGPMRSASSGTT